ncbi:hypothetical protein LSH36_126g00031 [Paralvinella palmiformis]|uniref:Uncharacterized protein n=1 Tax=Paralvinella palmiformis TaxID=53620 RepID=A0AAD9N8K3_9ANNE|nr:hypothetical protein LSH36_126g00031 [Paralvinella palmiformis]
MPGFHSASEYTKTCLVLLLATAAVLAVSYGAPYWTTTADGHSGLWWGCRWDICYMRWDYWTSAWVKATQAFMTMAIITVVFAILCLGAFIYQEYFYEDKRMVALSMILTFATSLFIMVAVFTWASNEHYGSGEVLNWPFALACACCLTSFVTGWFLFMELRRPDK